MVFIEHLLGCSEIGVDLALLAPRQRHHRVDVIAHHRRLGRHRRHELQLLEFRLDFLARLLGHASGFDLLFNFVYIGAIFTLPKLFLDRLYLLVQVVLTLALLHLAFDAATDALLDLQDVELALHQLEKMLEALLDVEHFENFLLLLELQRQMRGNGIAQPASLVDACQRGQDLGGNLLVELHILIELLDHGATHRLDLVIAADVSRHRRNRGGVVRLGIDNLGDARALTALNKHLDRAVGQFQHLQNISDAGDFIHVLGGGLIFGCRLLGNQHDAFACLHRGFQRLDGFRAPDEQRNDHVRKNHHVAQRQQRQL